MIVAFTLLLAAAGSQGAQPRVVTWQSRAAAHEAKQEWCDALFYRTRALAEAGDQETRYRAFLDAYAIDQLRTAHALVQELRIDALGLDDDARAKVDNIISDLESLETLQDVSCTHAPVCGDEVIEGAEVCDGDARCTPECTIAVAAPKLDPPPVVTKRVVEVLPVAAADGAQTLRVAGMVATGAGVVAAGAGAAVAFFADETIADPLSTGPFKERAMEMRTGGWVAIGLGAAVAAGGAIAFGVSETKQDVDDGGVQ